jgi:cytochrome c oxidase subunit 3
MILFIVSEVMFFFAFFWAFFHSALAPVVEIGAI